MGNKSCKKKLPPFTYRAAFYDPNNKIKVYANDLTKEQYNEMSKQVTINFANSLLRPYGVVVYISE